ncbi:MAG: methylmalonyl Co-A mutase-associated GTPase MeaB [candidate division WOR-3 bacterium]|nr:methylmalonyl Co-A mutase-associated GTPase MeaB [candidate division WOR-3 bacterium]
MLESTVEELLRRFARGDRRACGQVISLVEDEAAEAKPILNKLYPLMGRAYRVGVTGPPGAGKSTLVEKLARHLREYDYRVGIVAVDPSSPFSGGAVLGDRVRMAALFTDPGVYIRSMATRGSLGGLARRTREVCDILDAFGCDYILIETVGVGQMELDIAEAADSTVVVLVPESGDSIQALKAGLMEIGEIFCVNKCDREGADRMVLEIQTMLELRPKNDSWIPPVVKTAAISGLGIEELYERISAHRRYLETSSILEERRRRAVRTEIERRLSEKLQSWLWRRDGFKERVEELVEAVMTRRVSPYEAVDLLFKERGFDE